MRIPGSTMTTFGKFLFCGCLTLAALALQADVSVKVVGTELVVTAPASHSGERLLLLWDDTDHGADTNAWAHAEEIAVEVPSGGGSYRLDLNMLGVISGQTCRILSYGQLNYLDKLGTSATAYINTGIKDTDCYGVAFGFYAETKTTDWGYFLGSSESTGFVVGNNNTTIASWNWAYRDGKKSPRPGVSNSSVNEAVFGNAEFWLNGTKVVPATTLGTGSVGTSGNVMYVGRMSDNRTQAGWWSHVSFSDADGNKLIDYIPVQFAGSGRVAFYDRVSGKYVYSSASGDFVAGDTTNSVTVLSSSQVFVPCDFEPISVSVEGNRLAAHVPASVAGERLLLLWDDVDKGTDVSAWAHSSELTDLVAVGGGTYVADLDRLGVDRGQVCSVATVHQFKMLDMLKMTDYAYVDTGIKDSDCYGVRLGFYGNESAGGNGGAFENFIGSGESEGGKGCFSIGMNNKNFTSWYYVYRNYKENSNRPTVSTTSINEVSFENQMFTLNGSVQKSDLEAGPVGESGRNILLGTVPGLSRFLYGWWSHVSFQDVNGSNIIDYIPVQRISDGKVGFYDRVTKRFVESSSTGDFLAGTVTNEAFTATHLISEVVRPQFSRPVSVSLSSSRMTVTVSSMMAGEKLVLVWDSSDKGNEISAWAHAHDIATVVPANGGSYTIDLSTLGITREMCCSVMVLQNVELLDMIQMPDSSARIDTGVPDSLCFGVRFGFYETGRTGDFANFIGTDEDQGFTVGADGASSGRWYWAYREGKKYPRPDVRTGQINDAVFGWGKFTLNGADVNTSLPAGAVGTSGKNMILGGWVVNSRAMSGWWTYVRFDDAAGSAIIDYVPAKRKSDGKVGCLDRASGLMVFSSGATDFIAGTTTNENVQVLHARRTFVPESVVTSAVWTGAGEVENPRNPANWSCLNPYGDSITACPTGDTVIRLPVEMPGDCDLSSFAGSQMALSGTIDLAGHAVALPLDAASDVAATVTDTIGGGVLGIVVPKDGTFEDTWLTLTGALKLALTGDGTFVATKTGQTYTGGTEIRGGTFRCGNKGSTGIYGSDGGTVTVFADGTFDANGYEGHSTAKFVLAGGTVTSSAGYKGSGSASGPVWFTDVTLTTDSAVYVPHSFGFSGTLALGEHTLNVSVDPNPTFDLCNLTVTGAGTIFQRKGGYIGVNGVTAKEATLEVNNSVQATGDGVFKNYISHYDGGWDLGQGTIKVLGRFDPGTAKWHRVELQNGATLDLSQVDDIWTASCRFASSKTDSTLIFAENATIYVQTGRELVEDMQLVAWTDCPAKTVTFAWADDIETDLPLNAFAKGLFAKPIRGTLVIFK